MRAFKVQTTVGLYRLGVLHIMLSTTQYERLVPHSFLQTGCLQFNGVNLSYPATPAVASRSSMFHSMLTAPVLRSIAPGMQCITSSLASWEERCQRRAWLLPWPAPRPFERARGQPRTPRTCGPCERPLLGTRYSVLCFRCAYRLAFAQLQQLFVLTVLPIGHLFCMWSFE